MGSEETVGIRGSKMGRTLIAAIILTCFSGCGLSKGLPLNIPYNLDKNESAVASKFSISKYRNYTIAIRFEYKNKNDLTRVRNLIGDGGCKIYTKESAGGPNPVLALSRNAEEAESINKGLLSGLFVRRPTDFSGQLDFKVRVVKLNRDGGEGDVVADLKTNTLGYFVHGYDKSGSGGYFDRSIVGLSLLPGQYLIDVRALDGVARFEDVDTKLIVTFNPNENALKK